ncbi:MAG: zinc-ribbon domain-containing protein [Candidatus Omnitrophica bacterium]|nr:zinc-ribbon domain-containing protein [Candidatus Omnitrophota bacterium]
MAKEWHPTKNRPLTLADVVPGSHRIVWWKCEKGHEWQARIDRRSNGSNCPACRNFLKDRIAVEQYNKEAKKYQ